MNLPTLRQMSFLVALADHRTFIAAAEAVGVTQPSLSAAIKELEANLQVKLVERARDGTRLTVAGAETVKRARQILTDVMALGEVVKAVSEPLSGSFRLGVIPTIAPFMLPRALPEAKRRFPKLRLFLREDITSRLMEALRAREIDAALIALPYEAHGIETEIVKADEFVFVGPKDHPFSTRADLSLADLDNEKLLLLEDGHCLREHALAACRSMAVPGESEVRATSLFTLVQMVAGGLGVSLIPAISVASGMGGADVCIAPFNPPIVGRQIGMAWRRGSSRKDEARAMADVFRAVSD
jgi:LysR family transcriptional regulator, hydrogen peroxide-inducible genes activator